MLGYLSQNIPGWFITNICEGVRRKDIVRLENAGPWQAVIEGVEEFGKYFIRYAICKVGFIPLESNMTTQLVAPLLNPQPFPLWLLVFIYITLFSFFIWSLVVFREDPQIPHAGTEDCSGSLDEVERSGAEWWQHRDDWKMQVRVPNEENIFLLLIFNAVCIIMLGYWSLLCSFTPQ